jgi:hypothetical protein
VSIPLCRLDIKTMFKIREWERYKFLINYEHEQARGSPASMPRDTVTFVVMLW